MTGCRFASGVEWVDLHRDRDLRRSITRVAAEQYLRAGMDQHGKTFVPELLDAAGATSPASDDEAMFEAAVRLLMDGSIVLIVDAEVPRTLDEPKSTPLTSLIVDPSNPVLNDTGFITIQLVEDSGVPMPNERYLIRPPVDDDLSGRLDANGEAHHAPIAKGDCRVSFPDIDKGDWRVENSQIAEEPGFIDVVVTDEDEQPIAGAAWEIELQGGETQSGVADATGRIFLPDIEFLGLCRLVVTRPAP